MQWITNCLVAAVQSVSESKRESFVKNGEQNMLEDGIVRDGFDGDGSKGKSVEVIEQHQSLGQILDPEFSTQRPRRKVREIPPEYTPTHLPNPECVIQIKDRNWPTNAEFRQIQRNWRRPEERYVESRYGTKITWDVNGKIYEPIDEATRKRDEKIA